MHKGQREEDEDLRRKIKSLEVENTRLKKLLERYGILYEESTNNNSIPVSLLGKVPKSVLSLEEKVTIFRALFRGREDVFAKRWYSPTTNKSGYQPACEREWDHRYCDKKKVKCASCPNRRFSSLGYEHFFAHLSGKDVFARDVLGIYPLLNDGTCYFLCVDFDDKSCKYGYEKDVLAFIGVCQDWKIPAYIERSRSGTGAHVWLFFTDKISASKVRRLGYSILTEAMNRGGRLSFASYDRLFPNQDSLPQGGLGNLVALPLQGKARREGNSVFVDQGFVPFPDQWAFLQTIRPMTEAQMDSLLDMYGHFSPLGNLSKTSDSAPWEIPNVGDLNANDFSPMVEIVKANMIFIPLKALSSRAVSHFRRIASFRNPVFYARRGMHLSTHGVPRVISCADFTDDYLVLPRGCEEAIVDVLRCCDIQYHIIDKRNKGREINVSFKGKLRGEQMEALSVMRQWDIGTLSATTGFGKTVFAIAMIAEKRTSTLVLVHTRALLDQWINTLSKFLEIEHIVTQTNIRGKERYLTPIGAFCSTKKLRHGIVDVALIQSCFDSDEVKPFIRDYGMVIVDECHHVSSVSFETVLKDVNARYVYGLTATPIRKDGLQPIIFMQCGPVRFSVDASLQIEKQKFDRILIPRFTTFRYLTEEPYKTYVRIIKDLATDELRNKLIIQDVKNEVSNGRPPIILTNLTSHVKLLAEKLKNEAQHVVILLGVESSKRKREIMEKINTIPPNESLIIVATGRYVGEGFDYPRLDTLFLALPCSRKGLVAQYTGRLHREYKGKADVRVYDYVDIRIALCELMYRRRLRGYAAVGYQCRQPTLSMSDSNIILDGQNYYDFLRRDLASAKQSIIISSPKINFKRNPPLLRLLTELQHTGIEVVLHTVKGQSLTSACEMDLIEHKQLSLSCVIIDKTTLWYGSVQFFGSNSSENNVMRIDDSELSNEIINLLYDK